MDKTDIGAIWCRKSKAGKDFMTGVVTIDNVAHEIVMFTNNKTKPNHPDWRIYKSEPPVPRNANGTEKVDPGVVPF